MGIVDETWYILCASRVAVKRLTLFRFYFFFCNSFWCCRCRGVCVCVGTASVSVNRKLVFVECHIARARDEWARWKKKWKTIHFFCFFGLFSLRRTNVEATNARKMPARVDPTCDWQQSNGKLLLTAYVLREMIMFMRYSLYRVNWTHTHTQTAKRFKRLIRCFNGTGASLQLDVSRVGKTHTENETIENYVLRTIETGRQRV